MQKFVEFVKTALMNQYAGRLGALVSSHIPVALCLNDGLQKVAGNLAAALKGAGLNLQIIIMDGESVRGGDTLDINGSSIKYVNRADLPRAIAEQKIAAVMAPMAVWASTGLVDDVLKSGAVAMEFQNAAYSSAVSRLFAARLPEIFAVYDSLDEAGRDIYSTYWLGRISGELNYFKYAESKQYFLAGYLPQKGDITIDGGAFDGCTAIDFNSVGAVVYSFELDAKNFVRCRECAAQYGFTAENMGLGEKEEELRYNEGGAASTVSANGDMAAHIIDLDTYAKRKDIRRIDFIKLDIEGAELAALRGAANSISKWKPKMAICLYHKLEDLWEIPMYIKSLRPDYEFTMRHYSIDSARQQKTCWEAVLYCR